MGKLDFPGNEVDTANVNAAGILDLYWHYCCDTAQLWYPYYASTLLGGWYLYSPGHHESLLLGGYVLVPKQRDTNAQGCQVL